MNCAVTGANGFLGRAVVKTLEDEGTKVFRLVRNPSVNANMSARFALSGTSPSSAWYRDNAIKTLIHCAYDFSPTAWAEIKRINVEGSLELFRNAREGGVAQIIFVSSLSAFDGCKSKYGRAKLLIEQFGGIGFTIIRPGLIYDRKSDGLVGRLQALIAKLPVVPVIGSGRQIQYTCHREDLANLIRTIAGLGITAPKLVEAANDEPQEFISILRLLAVASQRRPLFLRVPSSLVYCALRLFEFLRLPTGLKSDSVVSLENQNANPSFSQMKETSARFRRISKDDFVAT